MMTLDELAGRWLKPQREEDFSLPTITNFYGAVQAAWDISGIQNWMCPPTGMSTATAVLYEESDGRIRRFPRAVIEYRWKAYELERRGGGLSTVMRTPEGRPAVVQRLKADRDMRIHLTFHGLPRVWRFTHYWNVPPEDVPQMNLRLVDGRFVLDDCKTFGRAEFRAPGTLRVYSDLHAWLDGDPPLGAGERGRIGVATIDLRAGQEVVWSGEQGTEAASPLDIDEAWDSARSVWERTWRSVFTPGNPDFSGHLPYRTGEFERLYCMAVLTLLLTRRMLPPLTGRAGVATGGQCIWNESPRPLSRAYVFGGPEGAFTTSFLWELEFQAPLLARLDPVVLRAQLEALIRANLHKFWGVEVVSGRGAGMSYGVNPGAFLSCVRDYVRVTGDRQWALDRLDYLQSCARPELTDYGDFQHILECVSTYEHTIAAFNALNVKGLRFLHELTGNRHYADQAAALAARVLSLYAGGPFACLQPDGSRRVVKTVLDFVYVGMNMTEDIPQAMRTGMVDFFLRELKTKDWLYALSPQDSNALTPDLPSFQTFRADHQATGSYDGWPAKAAAVLHRFGYHDEEREWLWSIQELTHEGPFGQAHYCWPDGARKASFFNGNVNTAAAGCAFATLMLDEWADGPAPKG
jgi:hypothetical protein